MHGLRTTTTHGPNNLLVGCHAWSHLAGAAQSKGLADAGAAAFRVSGLEVGGLFGSLLAGRISDSLIARSNGRGGNVGKRVQVWPCVMLPLLQQPGRPRPCSHLLPVCQQTCCRPQAELR